MTLSGVDAQKCFLLFQGWNILISISEGVRFIDVAVCPLVFYPVGVPIFASLHFDEVGMPFECLSKGIRILFEGSLHVREGYIIAKNNPQRQFKIIRIAPF